MKRFIPILMMLLLLTGCGAQSSETSYRQISMEEAVTMMEEETGYIILDVRTAQEYSEKHIPGAINIANEFPRKSPRKGLTSGRHLCYDVITSRRRAFFSCAFLAFGPLLFPHGRAADHFSPQRGRQKKSEV